MNISYHTILKKMEEKLIEAKSTNSNAHIREHVQAIKTLCEVILMDDGQSETSYQRTVQPKTIPYQSQPTVITPTTPSTSSILGEKRLETDDGANGDSIFDF
ncbi:YwdI family protein [Pallidibacillus thermolactis]|jgi:hypothetical protein|uniref:YwdI family protein n=1 Tax=Pallidibacillus thermolactis TaxID=251051 RepID=UPI002E1DEADA|nr:YwdI family protein [Pallidibacillus thermolactis subsp. kokeshiiformis]